MNPRPFTIVDRDVFSWNFLHAIEPLTTAELRQFLDKALRDNHGTEGEALIITLTEGQLALRALLEQGTERAS